MRKYIKRIDNKDGYIESNESESGGRDVRFLFVWFKNRSPGWECILVRYLTFLKTKPQNIYDAVLEMDIGFVYRRSCKKLKTYGKMWYMSQKVKEAHSCPKCKLFYEEREVDYNNIARETGNILSDFKTCLLGIGIPQLNSNEIIVGKYQDQEKNTFACCNKTYHINFVDELFSKTNTKGWAPLEILLQHGALIDIAGPDYETPLHKAASVENEQLCKTIY
ncbi:hypothetical protein NQ317_011161 [Molorchus minor]|uniref:Uncharacterized protein n=1 Tax=Molorchus minor TaxID=1323400 RepID=A0ABQ9IVK7_9CUCU|nr:hypothetical protein NQ317_011161 [Molorchus minor]